MELAFTGIRPGAAAAGLDHISPHDLRHMAASLAIAPGVTVKAVQSMLGHASAAMTLDIYASLFADELDAVADAPDAFVPQTCRKGRDPADTAALEAAPEPTQEGVD